MPMLYSPAFMPNVHAGWSGSHSSLALRVIAAGVVLALHGGVAALMLMARPEAPDVSEPEAVMVRFVEIGPAQQTQAPVSDAPPAAEIPPEPRPEPEPEIEPEPEPEPTPPEPLPEVQPEPEPQPEPQLEPTPAPEPPKHKPKPKPKPKPEPKPRPKPDPKPAPKPAPAPTPAPNPPSGTPEGEQAPPRGPQQDALPADRPRMIGRVDYLGQRPMPNYPRASQMRREEGRVVVRVLINVQGTVDKATVQRSSGYERLDQAALEAARKARFKPYTENGVPYPAMADLPFDFVLRN